MKHEPQVSQSYPNIFYIIVDCVRSYVSGKDDRDKLDIMFELRDECVDFENMIVSAPSSIMSISTAMTGIPSYYLAGNYVDFEFDGNAFWCLRDVLADAGYRNYSILNARTPREKLRGMLDVIDKKYWTTGIKHSHIVWPNKDVLKVFFNFLEVAPPMPWFVLVWFNARLDKNISSIVKELVNHLKARNLFYDSIFILTSDHGYPDQSRGLVSDGLDLKQMGLPHDLILTDDNIRVPFLLSYPGSQAVSVKQMVSNEDISLTILDVLGLSLSDKKQIQPFGQSMLPLIKGEQSEFFVKRVVRSDARFSMQGNRVTALRTNEYKYIFHHDDRMEELYDLRQDPGEEANIVDEEVNKEILSSFRDYFQRDEARALSFQSERLSNKFRENLKGFDDNFQQSKSLWVIVFGRSHLCRVVLAELQTRFPHLEINLILPIGMPLPSETWDAGKVQTYDIKVGGGLEVTSPVYHDVRLEIIDDRTSPSFVKLYDKFTSIRAKHIIRIDGNGRISLIRLKILSHPKVAYYVGVLQALASKKDLFRIEPSYLFYELKRLMALLIRQMWSRKKV